LKLYHHFGRANGLLRAAIAEAFALLLESKRTAAQCVDPVMALCEGCIPASLHSSATQGGATHFCGS
jgi:hypothetical protein